jgi:hypothetical protein
MDCWVEFGGQRIWAVDWTSGGCPIGLTEEQMADCENDDGDTSCNEVRSVLKRAFHDLAPNAAKLTIGRSLREKKLAVLRSALDEGIAELDAGLGVETTPDELMAEISAELDLPNCE